jgi:hypothetical protein
MFQANASINCWGFTGVEGMDNMYCGCGGTPI